ncbi:MAG TPA: very short patch repair endonuclease [Chitinophagaceae bacterium]|nr:very short patch repair endonuclease [Chitinophagaceae bacterium]
MSNIRSKNTKAELVVFQYLHRQNVYFQKHYKKAPGNPDIALPRKKKAVFIDGDFWHARDYRKTVKRIPDGYWKEKIKRNRQRDRIIFNQLRREGWEVVRVWESDIIRKRTRDTELEKIKKFLTE